MAIPGFQTIMLPLLRFLEDEKEHSKSEAVAALAEEFGLSDDERLELLPSGQQPVFSNRVGWARTYMKKAGLLHYMRRGHYRIAERGLKVLRENPPKIDVKFLERYEEFRKFRKIRRKPPQKDPPKESEETPEEAIESGYQSLRNELADDLLLQVKGCSPTFFERIVVNLLVKMGYGGTLEDAGKAIGRSGDEGIDGVIKEDRLGLDVVHIQAKRWENTVGRPDVQKFAGALQGQRAKKGVFITTSNFSNEARDYVSRIESKIVLIDGEELAQFMIDHGIGVTPVANYEIKRIDLDYFAEE